MRPSHTPLLPEPAIPTLAPARLDHMIAHALSHPQHGQARKPAFKLFTFPRVAVGGGAMALAASLALAVVLFHQPQRQANLTVTPATTSLPADAIPEISDYLIYTSLEQAAS